MSADAGPPSRLPKIRHPDEDMYMAITKAWLRMLTRGERRQHPLRPYVLARGFGRTVADQRVDRMLVAAYCARLACSPSWDELGGDVLPLEEPAREALDPLAARWQAFGESYGLGVHYFELGCGTIEFLSVARRADRPRIVHAQPRRRY